MFPLFAFFFLILSSEQASVCDNRENFISKELYNEILFSAKSPKVKRKYLRQFGKCIKNEGITLINIKNIPVAEILTCDEMIKRKGGEFFFEKGKLCSRHVEFFPSRSVFTIDSDKLVKLFSNKWKTIESGGTILFFNPEGNFAENSDPAGRVLIKKSEGNYIDKMGKPVYPRFVFEKGEWTPVFPLKELFDLKINEQKQFELKMITAAPVPYDPGKLIETTGLKASSVNIETPVPNNYILSGTEISGIRIPALVTTNKKSLNGTYIVRISVPALKKVANIEILEENFSITANHSPGHLEIIIKIKSNSLSRQEIKTIKAFMNSNIPSFYVSGDDQSE